MKKNHLPWNYTMEWDVPSESLYSILNCALRDADRQNLRPWYRYLKLFLTALYKLPSIPHQTVWRGVREDLSDEYCVGDERAWWALSSCTTSLKVLESSIYCGKSDTRTLFSIESFPGKIQLKTNLC
ncbi:unnamed protein product [Didymodactylos carnosus]|uniref:Mono(ADP-ribosyl)transferase n=1 Tax=Didymodactylos carnosus TaxID=1234261 RepID=A0A814F9B4_9BILA|nr:unnamed protein product [Didymodactylos carnosus]CAF1297259.1 unnamed protein product [Didymodactylos carnosus]CAF3754518.1 unnamed protein product [Didymodactylos carnosus]CAF4102610.1 unnamed protein product [Didymodactylos carnosus]